MTQRVSTLFCAAVLIVLAANPAEAAVTNVVTAKATAPSGPANGVGGTANASVDVQDAAPAINVVRTWGFAPGGDVNSNGLVDAGDQIVYVYTVRNAGNVSLNDVTAADVHDGTGAPLVVITPVSVTTDNGSAAAGTLNDSTDVGANNDGDWDKLGPNDTIMFRSQPYTIVPGDLSAPTSADNDLDGTVTAAGRFDPANANVTVNATSNVAVPLNIVPKLIVTKTASPSVNVAAGGSITYTYRVSNGGTVPITNVTLHDTHKGVLDALVPNFNQWINNTGSSNTGNTITVLAPGDEAEFTATYVVTQNDVDTLQ
jgi:large repetitive protein